MLYMFCSGISYAAATTGRTHAEQCSYRDQLDRSVDGSSPFSDSSYKYPQSLCSIAAIPSTSAAAADSERRVTDRPGLNKGLNTY